MEQRNNNLDYLSDPKLRKINSVFALSFKSGDNDPTRGSFDKRYMPLVETRDSNASRECTLSIKEGAAGGVYRFFKKNFVVQETIDLNNSWPCNFFRKCFMTPPINFSCLLKAYL